MLGRREFIKASLFASAAAAAPVGVQPPGARHFREALYYDRLGGNAVRCGLCPRRCILQDGSSGFCRARKNMGGTLYSLGYATPCAIHVDPIEKKPFSNFLPGSRAFSIASAGCNLRCRFCQNWEISQISPLEAENFFAPPERLPALAKEGGCRSIAYTYSEPTSFYEYMRDTAAAARAGGLLNVYHSNGFINPEPLKALVKYLDAANVDLKGFSEEYYSWMSEASLAPVLETLKTLKRAGVWLEITNLVVPGKNDDTLMVEKMSGWIAKELGPDTPLHFSRFYPLYKLTNVPPTPVETLERLRDTAAKAGLMFAYVGNVPGHPGENTYCPGCKKVLVKRVGYSTLEYNIIKEGNCKFCGRKVPGVWS